MNARSALFDLYGDHLLPRGGSAPVAALVRLLAPLDVAAPAVRTAVSRMVRQGWLEPVRLPGGAGYRATRSAELRLRSAADRIYRRGLAPWDGCWDILVVPPAADRRQRERMRSGLAFLGYAALGGGSWVSPRASPEALDLLAAGGCEAQRFAASYDGDQTRLVRRAWDLGAIGQSYTAWLAEARRLVGSPHADLDDEAAFRIRSQLVHEWRKFLFRDPSLPRELLPPRWPGDEAAAFFDEQAVRLAPGAGRFVDACLHPLDPGQ